MSDQTDQIIHSLEALRADIAQFRQFEVRGQRIYDAWVTRLDELITATRAALSASGAGEDEPSLRPHVFVPGDPIPADDPHGLVVPLDPTEWCQRCGWHRDHAIHVPPPQEP
jgi:hypothetical protein